MTGITADSLNEKFIACEAAKKVELEYLRSSVREIKDNVNDLYLKFDVVTEKIGKVDKNVGTMWAKITGSVVAAMAILQLVMKTL